MDLSQYQLQENRFKSPQTFHSSLLSVRKPQFKPVKKPIAPLPPNPPKVYEVDPINFKELVQKLTGSDPASTSPKPSQSLQRLQRVAPPPLGIETRSIPELFNGGNGTGTSLNVPPSPAKTPLSAFFHELMSESVEAKVASGSRVTTPRSLELNLWSPSFCSFPVLSPGTLSSLEQTTA